MGSVLSAQHLRKRYGQKEVVHEVSVSMQQGEIVGLLGPNGAGKTTSFYMITGIIKPTSGEVTLDGQDISTWPCTAAPVSAFPTCLRKAPSSAASPCVRIFR